ncbi:MAG: DUF4129 domain-containing protein [Acidobacteria bacterium]|nr:DUF4129 domain-containing protein [Acidobacteriota bacterium]
MRYRALILAVFIVGIFAASVSAASLTDYTGRLRYASAAANDLQKSLASGPVGKEAEERLLGMIETSLPAQEKIDDAGTTIQTDYAWLHNTIREYRAAKDLEVRRKKIASISAQLGAIEQSVNELVAATGTGPTKDADKEALEKILKRDEYKSVEPQESPLTKMFNRFVDWLFKRYPRPDIVPAETTGMPKLASALQIFLFLAIAIGLGFIGYKLVPHFAPRFKKDGSGKRERIVLGEVIGDDTTAHDLFSEAEELARSGQLTLAIRKAYIAALCGLEDRRLLKLVKYKTNRDYLFDLRKRDEIVSEMTKITREFETHWYGAKESTREDWERVESLYRQTLEKAEQA